MADNEYIKRSMVVEIIEEEIRRQNSVSEVLTCAHLRTAVMGLPTADVAPRAEVAREILAEIRDKGGFNDPFVEYICLSYDELIALERKYTKADPPKAKQPKDLENFEKKRLLAGDCFHGEIWYRCPYCLTGIEAHSIPKDRICHNCGKEYL